MIRLGLRLALGGGREVIVRLLVIAGGVMVGVALFLLSLSGLHILGGGAQRSCWQCTSTENQQPSVDESKSDPLLWRSRLDIYNGSFINRYDVAVKGPNAPVIPGLQRMPAPGEYYLSPALAELLSRTPDNQLDNRFPGKAVGQIHKEGLDSPKALIAVVGYAPADLVNDEQTIAVRSLENRPATKDMGPFIRIMFAAGAAGLLFTVATLIATATRLSAARREEKFAALRLLGATPRQINQLAAVDALLGAILGTVAGMGLFYLLRPAFIGQVADFVAFFPADLTPGLGGVLAVLIGVPLAAAAAALLALRRMQVSPLGVVRRATPKPPRAWRLIPLVAGLLVICFIWLVNRDVVDSVARARLTPYFVAGFGMTLFGLALAGPWLTMVITRLLARFSNGAALLLAMRRLADNPKGAFRPVSVLVIATFLCGIIAMFTPLIVDGPTPAASQTTQRDSFAQYIDESRAINPDEVTALIADLQRIPGVNIAPTYTVDNEAPNANTSPGVLVACDDIIGTRLDLRCPEGATALQLSDFALSYEDITKLAFTPSTMPLSEIRQRPVRTFAFWTSKDPALREQLRTTIAQYPVLGGSTQVFQDELHGQERKNAESIRLIISAAFVIILFIAGCSLAVAMGGGLVERKRPFGLLRVTGMSLGQLRRVVLIETAVPLIGATILASVFGLLVGLLMIKSFASPGEAVHPPAGDFYVVMFIGLTMAVVIITATLPLLSAMTRPENVRFE